MAAERNRTRQSSLGSHHRLYASTAEWFAVHGSSLGNSSLGNDFVTGGTTQAPIQILSLPYGGQSARMEESLDGGRHLSLPRPAHQPEVCASPFFSGRVHASPPFSRLSMEWTRCPCFCNRPSFYNLSFANRSCPTWSRTCLRSLVRVEGLCLPGSECLPG